MSDQSDFSMIGIDVRGIKEVQWALNRWPPEAVDAGSDALSLGMLNVLRQYPPKRFVTRKAAYGRTFFTKKQRRFFFWALHLGKISVPYKRTQALRDGWRRVGTGVTQILVNEREGAAFVMGNKSDFPGQARHETMVGWLTMEEVYEEHNASLIKQFVGGIKKALRKVGWDVRDG